MAKIDRPTIIAGNDTTLYIRLREFIEGEYVDFDLTQVSDLKVELLCAKDNYHYEIPYKIDNTYKNLIICDLKHTYYHSNTSYGIRVTGTNEDGKHWTWCMMPREGFIVVSNTSGLHLTDEAEQLSYNGLVGWGISYNGDLTNYYTKSEVDNLIAEIEIDLSDYYTKEEINQLVNQFPTKSEIDTRFNDYYTKTQVNGLISNLEDIVDDKQDTLVSGVNIKTINNESILGSGNIDIQGGGGSVEPIIVNYNEQIPAEIIAKILEQKANVMMYDTGTKHYYQLLRLTQQSNYVILEFGVFYENPSDTRQITVMMYSYKKYDHSSNGTWEFHFNYLDDNYKIENLLSNKQDTLVSGSNIKTINNESILGSGNIDIQATEDYSEQFKTTADALWDLDHRINKNEYITNKKLESIENSAKDTLDEFGDNVNEQLSVAANTLIEHSERLAVQSDWNETDTTSLAYIQNKPDLTTKQDTLISGTNIKTINGNDILGSGDITISSNPVYEIILSYQLDDRIGTTPYKTNGVFKFDLLVKNTLTNEIVYNAYSANDLASARTYIRNTYNLNPMFYTDGYNGISEIAITGLNFPKESAIQSYYINPSYFLNSSGKIITNGVLLIVTNNTTNEILQRYYANILQPKTTKDLYNDSGYITSSTTGLKIEVVSALPATPDTNTIYVIQ